MSGARRRHALLGLAAATLLLPGCLGSLFKSREPPRTVYLLSIAPASPAAEIPADLTILRPRVRTGLDTTQIAALYPDRRLDHFAGALWSGPLDEVVQDLALQAFHADARLINVHNDISAFGNGYWLEIDVLDFQAEYAAAEAAPAAPPTIHVRLVSRLGAAGDRRLLGQFEADVREPAADNRLTAIIDAYNRAASAALGQIVTATGRTLRGT